eukprot:scaffold3240_cov197-Alexandrium_tamarense.AAC.16
MEYRLDDWIEIARASGVIVGIYLPIIRKSRYEGTGNVPLGSMCRNVVVTETSRGWTHLFVPPFRDRCFCFSGCRRSRQGMPCVFSTDFFDIVIFVAGSR